VIAYLRQQSRPASDLGTSPRFASSRVAATGFESR
jgi:hypothetical protein